MSKKIISAILVMAMIVSMSATAIIGSLGAAAATDYEADRTALKAAIEKLVVYGPELEDRTYTLLEETGLLTWNDEKKEYQAYLDRAAFWGNNDPDYFLFLGEGDTLAQNFVENNNGKNVTGKVEWVKDPVDDQTYLDLAKANVSNIVEYAASAWYFGQDANNEIVDASFNEGRNAVVKAAKGMIDYIFEALSREVTATAKPAGYADLYDSSRYMGFFMDGSFYNQSIGFNPYFYIIDEDDYWTDAQFWGGNALRQYPVRWYTFAEARQIAPDEVFAFEIALRELAMKKASTNGAGVLYWDFLNGDYKEFRDLINALVEKLIGKIDMYFGENADFTAQYKAFLKLEIVIDIYDKYIKDVYNNIYTASAAQLLNDVLYAKRVIEYIREKDSNARLMILALTDFNALIDKIVAGIKAVAPRSEQQLSALNVAEGTELVRKAEALLKNWDWSSKKDDDPYKIVWTRLYNAKEDLKTMLPAAAGESVLVIVPEGVRTIKDLTGVDVKNDRVTVEFTPNWFSYWKFSALLKAALDNFNKQLTAATLPDITTSIPADPKSVVNEINKYAFLAGVVGPILQVVDGQIEMVDIYEDGVGPDCPLDNLLASITYSFYLFDNVESRDKLPTKPTKTVLSFVKHRLQKDDDELGELEGDELVFEDRAGVSSIYEAVVGYARGNNATANADAFTADIMKFETEDGKYLNQDVALDSVYNFIQTLFDVAKEVRDDFKYESTAVGFDWTIPNGTPVKTGDAVTGDAAATGYIGRIRTALKYLTADLTTLIQVYGWVLENVAAVLDWEITTQNDADGNALTDIAANAGDADFLECVTKEANYPKDYFKTAKVAAANLAKLIAENKNQAPATKTSLLAAYDKFVKALKSYILTEAGAAKFDSFVEDVYYIVDHYFGEADSYNYEKLYEKLSANANTVFFAKLVDARNCYQYFQMKFEHAVEDAHEEVAILNLYYGQLGDGVVTPLKRNYLDPMNSLVNFNDVSGLTRDFADKYQELRRIGALILGCINGDEATGYTVEDNDLKDMPVWYAEKVLEELSKAYADRSNYTTAGLVAYKAELEALIREADGKNVYAYKTNTDEAKAIWDAFVAAYANAQYVALDTRCPKADVDDAVAALKLAMANLEKIEATEGAADKDTLAAKVAAAEALYVRANVTDDKAAKDNLEVAISEAKKALQFTISVLNSNDLETIIKNIDNAMSALTKSMYTGKNLKKDTKVLELQVVVELYTEASYRKFANAVEAAYAMAEADTATESQMMAAYKSVADRFADLKLAPVEEPVQEPEVVIVEVEKPSVVLEQAKAIYKEANDGYAKAVEGCTADTAAAYKAAIDTLKADIDKEADDAKLLSSIIALNLAKAGLTVDVPETIDD
jgi:hypothetical protein